MQRGATYSSARARAEGRVDRAGALDVADPGQRPAGQRDAERVEVADGPGHQSLAARLVDGRGPRLVHDHVEAGAGGVQGGGQTDRAAADHHDVTHRRPRARGGGGVASAWSSTRIRTASNPALSTVKTSAVIHAACTSGRAAPSTTTAT